MAFQTKLTNETLALASRMEEKVFAYHKKVDEQAFFNQQKVLAAFRNNQVSDFHLHPSTGYGYDDEGRDNLERVYAEVFGAEAAIVRPQIISGTHAITLSLFGVLRPGDELVYITGKPYDTLQSIVDGGDKDTGSLKDYKIGYSHVDLIDNQDIDWEGVRQAINDNTKMVAIQRSKGYASRPSFTIEAIREMVVKIREIAPLAVIFVDNCYGEFVETLEPTEIGVDLMAGSLIKNPGGGLAKIGGYIAGRADLVEKCAYRMTSPGI
ncbi:MAG: methionine gamma-lyase family protein, partial [Solibacillus sp.]